MALIGTIRKNGWILIVLMILALGGFILMDVVTNAQRYAAGDVNTMGKVNGKEIKRAEFDSYEKLIFSNAKDDIFQARQQIWNYFVEQALVTEEAEDVGLGVGKEELIDLQFGNNLSPIVAERFKGADGQPNRATLSGIKSAIEQGTFTDPVNRAYWATQEKEIIKLRLQEKLSNLVIKGLYTPLWQAEMTFKENNEHLDFAYVRIPYEKLPDSDVQLTDEDYTAYLKDNPHVYDQQEELRIISYVSVDVYPTAGDSAKAREAVVRMMEGLRSAPNDSVYVVSNSGIYGDGFRKPEALPILVADSMLNQPVGTILGPFEDMGAWNTVKILGRKIIPDSVRARHILIRDASPENEKKIDSLMALLKSRTVSFDSLAIHNSQDPGSAIKGGDLGWFAEGQMVPEFNNICFFEGVPGQYYKVATQFGWHLIELTGRKVIKNEVGVKYASMKQNIEPSTQTQQVAKDRALALVQQAKTISDLTTLAGKEGLTVQNIPPVKANDFSLGALGNGNDAREIIRWAFDEKTKIDAVGKEIFSFRDPNGGYFDSRYVVAALKSIVPEGPATIATLKATTRAEQEVKNRKKAELIKSKLPTGADLSAFAGQWDVAIDTAKASTMLQTYLPNGGNEPRVVGTAFSLQKDATSAPISGNTGVYIVKPINDKTQSPVPADLTLFRRQVTSSVTANVRMTLMAAMKKQADLKDNRSRFF